MVVGIFNDMEGTFGVVRDGIGAHRDRDAATRTLLLWKVGEEDIILFVERHFLVFSQLLPRIVAFMDSVTRSSLAPTASHP